MGILEALKIYSKKYPERGRMMESTLSADDLAHFTIWYGDFEVHNHEHADKTAEIVVSNLIQMEKK